MGRFHTPASVLIYVIPEVIPLWLEGFLFRWGLPASSSYLTINFALN